MYKILLKNDAKSKGDDFRMAILSTLIFRQSGKTKLVFGVFLVYIKKHSIFRPFAYFFVFR